MRLLPAGIGPRALAVPTSVALVVAVLIAELIPRHHDGGAGLLGVAAVVCGAVLVAASAVTSLSYERGRRRRLSSEHFVGRRIADAPSKSLRVKPLVVAHVLADLARSLVWVTLMVYVFDRTHSVLAVGGLIIAARGLPLLTNQLLLRIVRQRPIALVALQGIGVISLAGLVSSVQSRFTLLGVLMMAAVFGSAVEVTQMEVSTVLANNHRRLTQRASRTGEGVNSSARAVCVFGASCAFALSPIGVTSSLLVTTESTILLVSAGCFALSCLASTGFSHFQHLCNKWAHYSPVAETQEPSDVVVLLGILSVMAVAIGAFATPLTIAYAKVDLHASTIGYGALLSSWGTGMMVARGSGRRLVARFGILRIWAAATGLVGLAFVSIAAIHNLPLACGVALCGGLGAIPFLHLMGLMAPRFEFSASTAYLVGVAVASILATSTSPRVAFLVGGIGAFLTVLAFLRLKIDVYRSAQAYESEIAAQAAAIESYYPESVYQATD